MNGAATRREKAFSSTNGYLAAAAGVVLLLAAVYVFRSGMDAGNMITLFAAVVLALAGAFCLAGLFMLQPNESAILTLFGKYIGTDRSEGLRWAFPLYVKRRLSLRARNFNAPTLKVNDKRGNPVEISAAIVWRVRDTAQAVFEVDDFERYVAIQAEAALRHLASQYAYDEGEDLSANETTLRGGMDVVADALKCELQARFEAAGVEVVDAKLTHLAYAAEIAQVMLRRQQAEAIISARAKIVHGAVSMVEAALKGLSERGIVELDDERKAAMVSNLLVVLCSDKETQPIINTGTLYN
ncbi:UNVERIFIED_ORG: regulator of protease activity HflC (stomatin/prohibitin superfamily) [Zoogloea ramigera]|uniref:SPFH domain-containing protein n=1 Tax=Duganella zoogloeoides TaxID=75659 RepID=A0ABZ0XS72_9BURK|nr:SPFH domain-containing protein [Duganella zoogloeoides]WQH02592.1 SPFH domain-containing protein [Duganella zoogloeoides]